MLVAIDCTTMELQHEDRESDRIDIRLDDIRIVYVSVPYDLKTHSAVLYASSVRGQHWSQPYVCSYYCRALGSPDWQSVSGPL
jgi:hypothetical protein